MAPNDQRTERDCFAKASPKRETERVPEVMLLKDSDKLIHAP